MLSEEVCDVCSSCVQSSAGRCVDWFSRVGFSASFVPFVPCTHTPSSLHQLRCVLCAHISKVPTAAQVATRVRAPTGDAPSRLCTHIRVPRHQPPAAPLMDLWVAAESSVCCQDASSLAAFVKALSKVRPRLLSTHRAPPPSAAHPYAGTLGTVCLCRVYAGCYLCVFRARGALRPDSRPSDRRATAGRRCSSRSTACANFPASLRGRHVL